MHSCFSIDAIGLPRDSYAIIYDSQLRPDRDQSFSEKLKRSV